VRSDLETFALYLIGKAARELDLSPGELHWECTAEVITGSSAQGYQGRMNFVYYEEPE